MLSNKVKEKPQRKKKESLPKPKKKMGRPKIDIDMQQLAAFCRLKPRLVDCAAFLNAQEILLSKTSKPRLDSLSRNLGIKTQSILGLN